MLIGFGFAGVGLAATTFMRSFVDFDYVNMAMIPLFLFSATFFPLSRYPAGLQAVVRLTPLYQGVVLERSLRDRRPPLDAARSTSPYLVAMGLDRPAGRVRGGSGCCSSPEPVSFKSVPPIPDLVPGMGAEEDGLRAA